MRDVLKYRNGQGSQELPVRDILSLRPWKGQVGIEIEVEGNKFPKYEEDGSRKHRLIPKRWDYRKDGSLRGVDNAEYVTNGPVKFSDVPDVVDSLWDMFDEYGSVLDVSNRTSVHVHLNAQEFYLNRLCAFVALYMSVEEILTEWCGQHRVGNMFCLSTRDAPAVVQNIKRFLTNKWRGRGVSPFPDYLHYSGLNLQALCKYGSIEVRTMRGALEPSEVTRWVSVLQHIYDLSDTFPDPRDICENFSGHDPLDYARMVLGEHCEQILQDVSFAPDKIRDSLYDGIRIAQDLCYCRNWSDFKKSDLKPDAFNRNAKNVLQSINEYFPQISNSVVIGDYVAGDFTISPTPVEYIPIDMTTATHDEHYEEF